MPSTGKPGKSMGIRHRTRKILLSGSLLAHSAALPEEWKSIRTGHSAQFRLLCTRLQPGRRKILWASDEAKGRESIGFSPDGKTMYIKGIKNNITAADVSKGNYTPLWNTLMPYEGNFIPTRMETTEEYVFIPTEFGVVHAVRTDGSGIAWSHKVSHSAVTSLKKAGDHRLIVMTMDGTVTCLIYP